MTTTTAHTYELQKINGTSANAAYNHGPESSIARLPWGDNRRLLILIENRLACKIIIINIIITLHNLHAHYHPSYIIAIFKYYFPGCRTSQGAKVDCRKIRMDAEFSNLIGLSLPSRKHFFLQTNIISKHIC